MTEEKDKKSTDDVIELSQERYSVSTESSSTVERKSRSRSDSRRSNTTTARSSSFDRTTSPNPSSTSTAYVHWTVPKAATHTDATKRSLSRTRSELSFPPDLFETKAITIICPGGQAPRIRLSRHRQVMEVEKGSKIDMGDIVTGVNGKEMCNRKEFYQLMQEIRDDPDCQSVKIDIKRAKRLQKLSVKEVYAETPKAFELLPGHEYYIGYMTAFPGCKIGMHIKSYNQKVYVSKTDDKSISSWTFSRGDVLLSIDGVPVFTIDDASKRIQDGLKAKNFMKSVVERPVESNAFHMTNFALEYDKKVAMNPQMADDVVEICKAQISLWKGGKSPIAKQSILRGKRQQQQGQQNAEEQKQPRITVAIAPTSTEMSIASDTLKPAWLQPVREKWTGDQYEQRMACKSARSPSPKRAIRHSASPKGSGENQLTTCVSATKLVASSPATTARVAPGNAVWPSGAPGCKVRPTGGAPGSRRKPPRAKVKPKSPHVQPKRPF